ncbi:UbiD family decarboxylase [Brucella melitensis]|nr:UbiD family decarboxylase [Brucella melitensis]
MKSSSSLPTHYDCLQSFLTELEKRGDLVRIARPVSLVHEVTEIHRRVLEADGPALLFENPVDAEGRTQTIPLLANLFGSERRIAWGLGVWRNCRFWLKCWPNCVRRSRRVRPVKYGKSCRWPRQPSTCARAR